MGRMGGLNPKMHEFFDPEISGPFQKEGLPVLFQPGDIR